MNRKNSFSRRGFVKGTAAAAGGLLLGRSGRAETPKGAPMDIDALKKACKGVVAAQGDANFTELIHGNLWNRLIPSRAPQIVVRVKDEQDVIAAIHFARENKWKVVVRGGGHNWCQPTLRNSGLLIDLSELNKVISIDVGARKAVVQPVISNRDIQKVLNPKGLAYPSGHCPQVKLSGYLLGGGMAWNQGVWGSGTESIEAIELVTAEENSSRRARTSMRNISGRRADRVPDSSASSRDTISSCIRCPRRSTAAPITIPWTTPQRSGAGSEKTRRKFHPLSNSAFSCAKLPRISRKRLPRKDGKVAMVTGAAFADSPEEAKAMLKPLEDCPLRPRCPLEFVRHSACFRATV